MARAPAPEAGIGLIEFLVSLLILTIVITGTMALQLTSLRTTTDSRISTVATTLAQSRLEDLRGFRTADLACASPGAGVLNTFACFNYDGVATTTGDSSTACSAYFVRTTTFTSNSAPCNITVTVQWTGPAGTQNVQQGLTRAP